MTEAEIDGAEVPVETPVVETPSEADALGDYLLAEGMVSKRQLARALDDSVREGSDFGQQLVINGTLHRRQLYQALAHIWGLELRDLVLEPPDTFTAASVDYRTERTQHWVPCEYRDGSLVVATSQRITPELHDQVSRFFDGVPVIWQMTTPWDLGQAISAAHTDGLVYEASNALADASPYQSARSGLTFWQIVAPAGIVAVLVALVAINVRLGFEWILTICDVVFTISILFKVAASVRQPLADAARERKLLAVMQERAARGLPAVGEQRIPDDQLPIYTVLVPVYHEANIVEKLIDHLSVLDYPKSKLEVMVLMETDDLDTINAARASRPPEFIRLVVVPPGDPQTKPRACNYGLALARGEYVVIFDAEDRPEPNQLRMAVERFRRDQFEREQLGSKHKQLAVVQAALHYFNADYNVLTRMFAIEYAHWFESMLPGLDGTGIPLPLGGTSNHFDTAILRKLGAWDPYNVTEDADLGLRASVMGYRVAVIRSSTGEEACSQTDAWIKQRTRWIKGYLMTAAVNLRHPIRFVRVCGLPGVVGMIGLILGTPLSFLCYPLMMAFTLVTWVGVHSFGIHLQPWVVAMSTATAIAGNLLMIVVSGIAATIRYNWRIGMFAVLNPIYWFLHSAAAWRALMQSFFNPHHWEKTPHGLSEDYESTAHH